MSLQSAADFQGQTIRFLGSCIISIDATPSAATRIFTTNELDIRAGDHRTFVFALAMNAGGSGLTGVLLTAGTNATAYDNWAPSLDPKQHATTGAVFYAPQGAPIYVNGLPFFVNPVAGLAGAGLVEITAYGWYW